MWTLNAAYRRWNYTRNNIRQVAKDEGLEVHSRFQAFVPEYQGPLLSRDEASLLVVPCRRPGTLSD